MLYILTCSNIDADTVIYVVSVIVYFRFYFASFYCMFVSSVTPLRITVMINKSTFLYRCGLIIFIHHKMVAVIQTKEKQSLTMESNYLRYYSNFDKKNLSVRALYTRLLSISY